jgi:ATP-binding cassette subfamily C protein/ATP-binding cassette subfamily C protein LapB
MTSTLTAESWGEGEAPDHFVRALACAVGEDMPGASDYARCLKPLLSALGWRGQAQHLVEILPHCAGDIDLQDLRNILANASFQSRPVKMRMIELDARLMPCLFVPSCGKPLLVLGR